MYRGYIGVIGVIKGSWHRVTTHRWACNATQRLG